MRKILCIVGWLLGILILCIVLVRIFLHEGKPEGQSGPAADELARQVISSIDGEAWNDTRWIRWTFAGQHHFIWNKEKDFVQVSWDDLVVRLVTSTQDGVAQRAGTELDGEDKQKALAKAWSFFCNDSYWLNPIVKAFDPGTSRSIVTTEGGEAALMVTHSSGGTTPGDSYLYLLDDQNRPHAWQMWVSIIPIGGIKVSWEGWEELPTGAMISTQHGIAGKTFTMISDLDAGDRFSDIGLEADPFADW